MAEAFKNLINATVVREVGHHLHRVWPAFQRQHFESLALKGLDELAFKARAVHLSHALDATLPDDFDQAAGMLEASLKVIPSPRFEDDPDKALGSLSTDASGLGGWALWSLGDWVSRHGLAHPERALQTLHALTQRFTAEFAIRPFIVAHPDLVFRTLAQWQHDPSAHVRRLVSEGSRPRLPWGLRLQALVTDPTPTLPLLRTLQDDPSAYVRRSVANHLNDIAKDHPDQVVHWLHAHLPQASPHRRQLLRHACRSLIKSAHPGVMAAWGLGQTFEGQVKVSLNDSTVTLGQSLTIEVVLQSRSRHTQTLELDYRVHYLKAHGDTAPKTFKGKRLTLAPGECLIWRKVHAFKPISTRRHYPGPHALDVQVNGAVHGHTRFELTSG
jgi:3-methyladenine DNA glycosylase AlkC